MTNILIHAREHDDARVVSAEFEVEIANVQALLDALSREMERVNAWAESSGAIVGHLKGRVEPCEGAFTLSTTGSGVNVAGSIAYDVGVTGIVMFAGLDAVREQVAGLAKNVLSAFGVADVEVEICDEEHEHHH